MGFAIGRDEKYLSLSLPLTDVIGDVCVKNSCESCKLIFPPGKQCREEMVRACEISRRSMAAFEVNVPSARSDPNNNNVLHE